MKKITFLIIFLLTLSLSFGQTNLIVNGNFETGSTLSGWQQTTPTTPKYSYGTDAVTAVDVLGAGTTHNNSNYVGRVLNYASPGAAALIQGIDVTPGETYIVDFWFTNQFFYVVTNVKIQEFTGDNVGANLNLTPIIADNGNNASNPINYGCSISDQNPSFDWKEAKFSFTVPSGVTRVRFLYYSNVGAYKYIDDVSMVLDATASVKDLAQFNFNVSPNPAKDYLSISAAKPINKIEVYNLLGQQVINSNLNSTKQDINVSNLSKGVYILKASIEDAVGTYKFVKQ